MNKRLTKEEFPTENDKSCPFCASREIVCEQTDVGESWLVWCRNCGAFGPNDLGWSGAIEMWNLRRSMDEVMGAVKSLFVSYEKMRHNQDLNHLATDMVNLTTSVDLLEITCPYCGNKFRQRFEVELHPYRQDVIALCDIDETPGCDKYFVVSLQLKINLLETYKLVPAN